MPSFKYLRDPLFLVSCALYFVNRWWLKPIFPGTFFSNYLNDVICIAVWVPFMLWGMRCFRLRDNDQPPQWYEILIPLIFWSVLFEVVLPNTAAYGRIFFGDPHDVLAYTVGATFSALFWHRSALLSRLRKKSSSEVKPTS